MRRQYRGGPHIRRGSIRPRARLLAYAQRLGLAPTDAEDLVQELYVLLLRSTDELVGDWFRYQFGCLRRLATNARRRERRRVRLLKQHAAVAPVDPGHGPRVLARCTAAKILHGLPPVDAALLRWRFLEELPMPEIEERLGTTENAASIRVHRALAKAKAATGGSADTPAR